MKNKFEKFNQEDHNVTKSKAQDSLSIANEFCVFSLTEDQKEIVSVMSCSSKFLKEVIQIIQAQYPALFTETLVEIAFADITKYIPLPEKKTMN